MRRWPSPAVPRTGMRLPPRIKQAMENSISLVFRRWRLHSSLHAVQRQGRPAGPDPRWLGKTQERTRLFSRSCISSKFTLQARQYPLRYSTPRRQDRFRVRVTRMFEIMPRIYYCVYTQHAPDNRIRRWDGSGSRFLAALRSLETSIFSTRRQCNCRTTCTMTASMTTRREIQVYCPGVLLQNYGYP